MSSLYPVLLISAFLNGIYGNFSESFRLNGLLSSVLSAGGINPILVLSVTWCAWSLHLEGIKPLVRKELEVIVIFTTVVLIYLPLSWCSWIAITLIGWRISDSNPRLGALCVYSAVPPFWGLIPVRLIGVPILSLDAKVVGFLTGYDSSANLIVPTDGGEPVSIYWACSSFHGINYAVLAWLTVASIKDAPIFKDVQPFFLAIFGVTIINWTRLILMVRFPDSYQSLHEGWASQIVSAVTLVWVLAVCHFGIKGRLAT